MSNGCTNVVGGRADGHNDGPPLDSIRTALHTRSHPHPLPAFLLLTLLPVARSRDPAAGRVHVLGLSRHMGLATWPCRHRFPISSLRSLLTTYRPGHFGIVTCMAALEWTDWLPEPCATQQVINCPGGCARQHRCLLICIGKSIPACYNLVSVNAWHCSGAAGVVRRQWPG